MNAIHISAAVRAALEAHRPVVALESTILAHGMPFPRNLETALAVEFDVREAGAVPAMIAVLDGTIRVGLDEHELKRVATAPQMLKLSRADLAYAVAAGRDGATTVAATMFCAHRAGIAVFATGGIGGAHRGVADTLDISADVTELARTPVLVVCAGAKAILDIPKTLELLETLGVPVGVYRSDEFPAFWSASSGLRAPLRFDDARVIAATFRTAREFDIAGGMLIANPIAPDMEIPRGTMTTLVERAVSEAHDQSISGKALTPWLLNRIYELSDGRSLEANVALVRANAKLAAEIAKEL